MTSDVTADVENKNGDVGTPIPKVILRVATPELGIDTIASIFILLPNFKVLPGITVDRSVTLIFPDQSGVTLTGVVTVREIDDKHRKILGVAIIIFEKTPLGMPDANAI